MTDVSCELNIDVDRLGHQKGDRLLFLGVKMLVHVRFASMPRIPRGQIGGYAYHVLNRGNSGATVLHKDDDFAAFLELR